MIRHQTVDPTFNQELLLIILSVDVALLIIDIIKKAMDPPKFKFQT